MNFLKILFAQMALAMLIVGSLINVFEQYLPIFVIRSFRYGKFAYQKSTNSILKSVEVPKSWFKHFYIYSSIISILTVIITTNVYIFNQSVPIWVINILNISYGSQRYSTVNSSTTYLALLLLTIQCCRRLYDTHFVSVFANTSRINILHYLVGFTHYTGAILAILSEAPKFSTTKETTISIKLSDISTTQIIAAVLFIWAWWHQYVATKILGNLRKDPKGQVVSQAHHLPKGDLFDYITSPHLSCEILMYLTLFVILWGNTVWPYVFVWVLINQVETALLSHWWYKEKFPKYPEDRKILIPFIY